LQGNIHVGSTGFLLSVSMQYADGLFSPHRWKSDFMGTFMRKER